MKQMLENFFANIYATVRLCAAASNQQQQGREVMEEVLNNIVGCHLTSKSSDGWAEYFIFASH